MKRKLFLMTAVALLATALASYASPNVLMGTWKLNEAKSKIPAGAEKNSTVVYTMDGDKIKCIIDGTSANGQASHNESTGKIDGKDYPVTGDPSSDSRAYQAVGARSFTATEKKGGKVTVTAHIVVAADGKTRTVTITSTGPNGQKITETAVYDKQ